MTDYGGDGTMAELEWSQEAAAFSQDSVSSSTAWLITQGSGRQVSCAGSTGYAYAKGVLSKSAGTLTKSLSTPTNGQWFLITRRITWSGTGTTTTLEAIAHSTTTTTVPTVPPNTFPTRNTDPGVLYDHILAWSWVRSTDTTMVLFDLRGVMSADDYGPINVYDADMTNSWTNNAQVQYERKNGVVYLYGRPTGGTTNTVFTLPAGFRPKTTTIYGVGSGTGTTPALTRVIITSAGAVQAVTSTTPNFYGISFPAAP